MQIYLLIDVLYRTPTASFLLVVAMAIAASLLINHILKAGFYITIFSIPILVFAGLLGNALLVLNHITLSPDKASNTAMATCFGFISIAATSFVAFRLWARIRDKR